MTTGQNHSRHDHFFRSVFHKPARTASLLRLAAQRNRNLARFVSTVDLDTLREIPESFADELDSGAADLVFTVRLRGKGEGTAKLLVGLIEEHKSYRDDRVFRQLIRYWHGIMVLKQGNIPTVALILYNGERPWNPLAGPMFPDYPEYYHQIRLPMIVEFIDVGRDFDEEQVRGLDPATLFALLVMKHAFGKEELQTYYASARDVLMEMPQEERVSLIRQSLLYLSRVLKPRDKEFFMDYVTHQDVYGEPSLYDVLQKEATEKGMKEGLDKGLQEGIAKGMEKGMEKGLAQGIREGRTSMAKALLKSGVSVEVIVKASGLSEAEVLALREDDRP